MFFLNNIDDFTNQSLKKLLKMTLVKYKHQDFWKNYMTGFFGLELIEKWYNYATEDWIISNGKEIHIEVYDTGNPLATTIVFSHGIAGYARMMLPFVIPLYEKGYNIIVPDLQGYGYNIGRKGDFEFKIHVQNLGDTVLYARKNFSGKIILSGASMGGPLAYAAAARFGNVDALACWCLFDFNDPEFIKKESAMGRWTYIIIFFMKFFRKLIGKFRIRIERIISYENLSDRKLVELVKQDPYSGMYLSINAAVSLITQSKPDINYDSWMLPTFIVQPAADTMTPAKYTKKIYRKLGSPLKQYIELEGSIHFPIEKKYYTLWAEEFDKFMNNL
jgi:alpha-beta hydrolase superfamily lysophospholipase